MLVALRKFSLGDVTLEPGDEIPLALQESLPLGRADTLKRTRYVEERTDEQAMDTRLRKLDKRIDKLERRVKTGSSKVGRQKVAA